MWIFGYGSLMSDAWEAGYDCTERLCANLAGYRRVFNKKSVVNWGTPRAPGLTLNLESAKHSCCRGIAFSLKDGEIAKTALAYLQKREACESKELPVRLEDGRTVSTLLYIYAGKNVLDESATLPQKAALVLKAKGKSGANRDYVRDTFESLAKNGIRDAAVTELWEAVLDAA